MECLPPEVKTQKSKGRSGRELQTYPSKLIRTPEEQYQREVNMCAQDEIAPEDLQQAERTRTLSGEFFMGFIRSMHEGTIPKLFSEWLTEDAEWSCMLGLPLYAVGVQKCVILYNEILHNFFGGPNSTVTFTIHKLEMFAKDRCRMTAISNTTTPTVIPPSLKHLHIRIRGNQVSEFLVLPVGKSLIPPPQKPRFELPAPTMVRPCPHNNWDSIRIKNQIALLRCRICTCQWKLKAADAKRCNDFMDGNCTDSCPKLHINTRKQTRAELEQRIAQ